MKNKLLLPFIGANILIAYILFPLIYLYPDLAVIENSFVICSTIAKYSAIVFLITNGSLLKSVFMYLIGICLIGFFIGYIFKILHWEASDLLILYSSIAISILYLLRFLIKKNKVTADYLKGVFGIFFPISYVFAYFHWIGYEPIIFLDLVLFVTVLFSIYVKASSKPIFPRNYLMNPKSNF